MKEIYLGAHAMSLKEVILVSKSNSQGKNDGD
jgi:hypothetical protein